MNRLVLTSISISTLLCGCEAVDVGIGTGSQTVSGTQTVEREIQGPAGDIQIITDEIPIESRIRTSSFGIKINVNKIFDRLRNRDRDRPLDLNDLPKMEIRDDTAIPEFSPYHVLFSVDETSLPNVSEIINDYGMGQFQTIELDRLGLTLVVAILPNDTDPFTFSSLLVTDSRVLASQPNYLYQSLGTSKLTDRFTVTGYSSVEEITPVSGKIAIIDTAVDLEHETLLTANISQQIIRPDTEPNTHGTAIAAMLVGSGNITGIAPGAEVLSIVAFEQSHPDRPPISETRDVIEAINFALRHQPDVLNLSWGSEAKNDNFLDYALEETVRRDICIFAAVGNGGRGASPPYPALSTATFGVTAVDGKKRIYNHATTGGHVDVATVGVDILGASPSSYALMSGTSFATAQMSGEGLRLGCGKKTLYEIAAAVRTKVEDLGDTGRDTVFGEGLFVGGKSNSVG